MELILNGFAHAFLPVILFLIPLVWPLILLRRWRKLSYFQKFDRSLISSVILSAILGTLIAYILMMAWGAIAKQIFAAKNMDYEIGLWVSIMLLIDVPLILLIVIGAAMEQRKFRKIHPHILNKSN